MSDVDLLILAISKNKSKIREIKKILAAKGNFEYDDEKLAYKIASLTSENIWRVSINKNGALCDCTFNTKWKEYRQGMKKHGQGTECIHILALKVYLAIKKLNIP